MYQVEDKHFWYQGMRKITKTLFDKYLPKNKRLKILDAGCGTGRNILFLKNYGQVYGLDISPEAIKYCKKRGLKNIKNDLKALVHPRLLISLLSILSKSL